jgi:sugar phosphate isomerase/epimerase
MTRVACSTGIRSTQPLAEACRAIRELGFRYVDPLAMEGWHIKPSRLVDDAQREAAQVRATFEAYGLACVAVNLGFLYPFTTCSAEEHRENLRVVKGGCTLARVLGTSILTVGSGHTGPGSEAEVLDRVSARLNEALAIAAEAVVTLALETHAGAISVYPHAARAILARCPGLRLTYDPSHYIAEGIPVSETLDLLGHTAHIHLRNARVGHFQERMSKGLLDLPWMVDQILASGYSGAIAIEYIEDCGALAEGYETRQQVIELLQVLLDKGLSL